MSLRSGEIGVNRVVVSYTVSLGSMIEFVLETGGVNIAKHLGTMFHCEFQTKESICSSRNFGGSRQFAKEYSNQQL